MTELLTLDPLSGFTCVACRVVFRTADLQRDHYHTDWHRYNLKRQVAELPPLTDVQFREKVLAFNKAAAQQNENGDADDDKYCGACEKRFSSLGAAENHRKSKKHVEMEKTLEERKKTREEEKIKAERRRVENEKALKKAAEAMEEEKKAQDEEEEDDSEGWQTDDDDENDESDEDAGGTENRMQLNEDDALPPGRCLFCATVSSSNDANLAHMEKVHDFRPPDAEFLVDRVGLLEYLALKVGAGRACVLCSLQFADVSAVQRHMRDVAHCRVDRRAEAMLEIADFYDYSAMYEEDGEGKAADEDTALDTGFELILPSGARLGHRQLARFYKQHLRPMTEGRSRARRRAAAQAALGWTTGEGQSGVLQIAKAAARRDIRFIEKLRAKRNFQLGLTTNKLTLSRGRCGQAF